MVAPAPAPCAACHARPAAPAHRGCPACLGRVLDDLDRVLVRAALAAAAPTPRAGGTTRGVPASRPPVDLDGADPTAVLVRPRPADPTSATPLLVALEELERDCRHELHLPPYGPASTHRATTWTARTGRPATPLVLLAGTTAFLGHQLPAAWAHPDHDLPGDLATVHACAAALARWDPDPRPPRTWVPCPTLTGDGECGRLLPVIRPTPDRTVACHGCGRVWTADRLVHVAGTRAGAWVDADAATALTGIPARTLRRWAATGRVRRHAGRYALADLRADTPTTTP